MTDQELDRASEQAYWSFRNRKNEYLLRNVGQQTERDAFKAECHKLIAKYGKAIPEGWQLVPKEPTEEMAEAADKAEREYLERVFGKGSVPLTQGPYDCYKAMLAAAPNPATPEPPHAEPIPVRPSRDIMFDTRPRDE